MRDLTERQERILEFFEDFLDEHDYPPTVRDIQRGCDISSTSVVSYNIDILKREGLIRKDDGVSRGLGLVTPRQQRNVPDTVAVPLVGSIAAGEPFPLPTAETWASGGRPRIRGTSHRLSPVAKRVFTPSMSGVSP